MHFDFIEIGTSDFETICQLEDNQSLKGLMIEPIRKYLDRLPNSKGFMKLCAMISDRQGWKEVWYIDEATITALGLPHWVKGCASDGEHPTVSDLLRKEGHKTPADAYTKERVPVFTLGMAFRMFCIHSVGRLKIDTEGHDCYILQEYFTRVLASELVRPQTIQFETNELTSSELLADTLVTLKSVGYRVSDVSATDTTVTIL